MARADNLKLTLPSAFATLQLAWGLLAAGSGSEAASSYDEFAWGARYLMACQQVNGSFVAQARPFLPNTHSVQGASPVLGIQVCANRPCQALPVCSCDDSDGLAAVQLVQGCQKKQP